MCNFVVPRKGGGEAQILVLLCRRPINTSLRPIWAASTRFDVRTVQGVSGRVSGKILEIVEETLFFLSLIKNLSCS